MTKSHIQRTRDEKSQYVNSVRGAGPNTTGTTDRNTTSLQEFDTSSQALSDEPTPTYSYSQSIAKDTTDLNYESPESKLHSIPPHERMLEKISAKVLPWVLTFIATVTVGVLGYFAVGHLSLEKDFSYFKGTTEEKISNLNKMDGKIDNIKSNFDADIKGLEDKIHGNDKKIQENTMRIESLQQEKSKK